MLIPPSSLSEATAEEAATGLLLEVGCKRQANPDGGRHVNEKTLLQNLVTASRRQAFVDIGKF